MTEKNLLQMIEEMPDITKENLEKGFSASYRSEKYPGKLLREYPDGRLESVSVDFDTGEISVMEILRESNKK